jgi:hypothetical protein
MLWLAALSSITLLLVYILIVRPILRTQPLLAPVFKAEATWWQQFHAKLVGFRTKLTARLLAIAGILVGLYDQLLPYVTGQDWTSLTSKLPSWSLPIGMVLLSWLFDYLRKITANPPHVIVQKDGAGTPMVVAVDPAEKA